MGCMYEECNKNSEYNSNNLPGCSCLNDRQRRSMNLGNKETGRILGVLRNLVGLRVLFESVNSEKWLSVPFIEIHMLGMDDQD